MIREHLFIVSSEFLSQFGNENLFVTQRLSFRMNFSPTDVTIQNKIVFFDIPVTLRFSKIEKWKLKIMQIYQVGIPTALV